MGINLINYFVLSIIKSICLNYITIYSWKTIFKKENNNKNVLILLLNQKNEIDNILILNDYFYLKI